MMFLCDMPQIASFAKKKEEKKRTLRDNLVGTTNAGKAFRLGALASGAGLGVAALKNKGRVKEVLTKPKEFFTKDAGTNPQRMEWYDAEGGLKSARQMNPPKNNPSFAGSGRKVNWGRVGKASTIAGGALILPTSAAYLAGDKKDKEEISRRTNRVIGGVKSTAKDVRTWVNTLHRVSR